jgi:hypothetical protein
MSGRRVGTTRSGEFVTGGVGLPRGARARGRRREEPRGEEQRERAANPFAPAGPQVITCRIMRRFPEILALLLGSLALGISGCGPDITALCTATEDCVGGNEQDIEACVAYYDLQAEIADIEGCDPEFNELLACSEGVADCQNEDTKLPCMADKDCQEAGFTECNDNTCRRKFYGFEDDDDCEVEQAAFSRCIGQ